jgi:ferredoxin
MKKIKVIHKRSDCIGCNACVKNAPQSWFMDENDGKSVLISSIEKGQGEQKVFVGEIFECDLEDNKKAAAACPVNIIRVEG